jgi:hypothetical protein
VESEKLVKGWKVVFPPTAPTGAEGKSNESRIRKANMEDVGCTRHAFICIGRSAASNRLLDGIGQYQIAVAFRALGEVV